MHISRTSLSHIFTEFGVDLRLNFINKEITNFIPQMAALIKKKLEESKLPIADVQNTANSHRLMNDGVQFTLYLLSRDPKTSPPAKQNAARAFGLIAPNLSTNPILYPRKQSME